MQILNTGPNDDGIPIYYELETQGIEFGNVFHLKKISDKIIVFAKYGMDSLIQGKMDGGNYQDIPVSLDDRVNIGQSIDLEGYTAYFRWSGEADEATPVFEGIYIEKVEDKGIIKK